MAWTCPAPGWRRTHWPDVSSTARSRPKVLIVRSRRLAWWGLPVAGGLLVTLIVVLWYSAALWYYAGFHLP